MDVEDDDVAKARGGDAVASRGRQHCVEEDDGLGVLLILLGLLVRFGPLELG